MISINVYYNILNSKSNATLLVNNISLLKLNILLNKVDVLYAFTFKLF